MLMLSFLVAGILAWQAKVPRPYDSLRSRLVICALCYAQPLVRSFQRYRTWLFAFPAPGNGNPDPVNGGSERLPLTGRRLVEYWSEEWRDRTELLNPVVAELTEHRWSCAVDTGWSVWDLEVSGDRYTEVQIRTVQEEHGSGKRLIRVRYRVHPRGTFWLLGGLGLTLTAAVAVISLPLAAAPAVTTIGSIAWAWFRGVRNAGQVARVFDTVAASINLIRCDSTPTANPLPEKV